MEENNKEINLLQLINLTINWFGQVLRNTFDFLGKVIKLSYKYKFMTLIVIVIFIGLGQYLSRPSARVFKAESMAVLCGSNSFTVMEVSKQLENTFSSNNTLSFASQLSLPDSVAKNIVSFQSFYVIDYLKDGTPDKVDFGNKHSLSDTLNLRMRNRIYFQLKTRSIDQIPMVEAAILSYFENADVLKTEFLMCKNELIEKISICNNESSRIDSLAKISYFKDNEKGIKLENNKLMVGEQKKQLFTGELLNLHYEKTNAEAQLANFKRPVELTSHFVVNPSPLNGSIKYGVFSILIGYLLSILLCALIDNFKKIKSFLER